MLISVIVHSLLAQSSGWLTYRAMTPVVPGQLVVVPLRGRTIPGIVYKCNVSAGTVKRIAPVTKVSPHIVPEAYLTWLELISQYYCVSLSHVFFSLQPRLTKKLLFLPLPPEVEGFVTNQPSQSLVITPSTETPAAVALRKTFVPVAESASTYYTQWLSALAGNKLQIIGTVSPFALPFLSLRRIIVDQPFATPYQSNRAPGYSPAVLACLLAKAHHAKLVPRTANPTNILRQILPLPDKTVIQRPKTQPIEEIIRQTGPVLNRNALATLKELISRYQKIAVIDNRLTQVDPKTGEQYGIEQTALNLQKYFDQPVSVLTKNTLKPTTALFVTTSTFIYQTIPVEAIFILQADSLIKPNAPQSLYETIDLLAICASRARVIVQSNSFPSSLITVLRGNFPAELSQPPPHFDKRIITITDHKRQNTERSISFAAELRHLFGNIVEVKGVKQSGWWLLAENQLTREQHLFLQNNSAAYKIFPHAYTFDLDLDS